MLLPAVAYRYICASVVQLKKSGVDVRDGFGLEGDALDEVLRYHLLVLFAEGAMPVVGRHGVDHWILKNGYGDTAEEMAASIVAEWRASGAGYPKPYDSLWFALPKMFKAEI